MRLLVVCGQRVISEVAFKKMSDQMLYYALLNKHFSSADNRLRLLEQISNTEY